MVTVDDEVFNYLQLIAKGRNISIQELFRAIVIPDWIERNMVEEPLSGPAKTSLATLNRP